MQLRNFQLGRDGIPLEWQGHYLDLHNCFDFERFTYSVPLRQIALFWLRSPKNGRKALCCRV